jgi:hypothetical protein
MDRTAISKVGSIRGFGSTPGGTLDRMKQLHAAITISLAYADRICSEQDGKCIERCPFGKADTCSMSKAKEMYPEEGI